MLEIINNIKYDTVINIVSANLKYKFKKVFIGILLLTTLGNKSVFPTENIPEDEYKKGVLQVKITVQFPNYQFPWLRKKPISKDAIGAYIGNGKILVLASEIEYSTSIEVKKFSSHNPSNAKLEKVDYEANLAIIKVLDSNFYKDLSPIKFEEKVETTKTISIIQLDNSGTIQSSRGRLTGIDVENYSTSYIELPHLSLSSNEKQEGTGELILYKNKFIGMMYKFISSKNSGRAIPGFIINQFLKNKKRHSTFPYIGFKYRPIIDDNAKEYYGLNEKKEGILIEDVYPYSGADGLLKTEDILLEAGGYKIDSQGFFIHPEYGKQSIYFLGNAGHGLGYPKGSKLPMKILRNKKELEINISLKSFPYKAIKIPYMHYFGKVPPYTIRGGFMFTELTEFFLREWGNSWRSKVDKKLLYLTDYHKIHNTKGLGRYVLMVQVLPDESNNGFHNLSLEIVASVNGKKVRSVKELQKLIEKSKGEIIGIQLENGVTIAIDGNKLDELDKKISQKFNIPSLHNLK